MTKNITAMMWTKKFKLLLILGLIQCKVLLAQPAPPQQDRILIVGATAHLGTGAVIENSAVGFSNGLIDFVGTSNRAERGRYDRIIEAGDHHLYPGFIVANTTLGLSEIDAIRATRDFSEVGAFNPNVRALIAYNAESMVTPTTVSNGVLLAQITPRSGVISGTSSVVHLDAWNWEDAAVREDDGIHLNWPSMTSKKGWYLDPGKLEANESAEQTIAELNAFFTDAKSYCSLSNQQVINLRLAAMCDVLNGKKTLYIHAQRVKDIAAAIHFTKKHNISNPVIIGGEDAWLIPEMFPENSVGLLLSRVHDLPPLSDDDIELPYKLPAIMDDHGVSFALQNAGSHERMYLRNFPFGLGTAVAHGLPYEQAIKAATLGVAQILGIDDRYGSVEQGKSATLFISKGDALDMIGNQVTHAFIDGRSVQLENRQYELFQRFKKRFNE